MLQDNLKSTYEWDCSKWEMNPCCADCTMAGEAHHERGACCHRAPKCQPWAVLAPGSTRESAHAPRLPQHHDHDTRSPSHTTPVPEPHTLLPQDSQTVCWPWSAVSASLLVKSQSRSTLVFLEKAPTPAQFFPQNSPQSQCQNTHSSS